MTGSSTLMLPLLLLLLVISFYQSSSEACTSMHEFKANLNNLSNSVKDCGNCSSVNIPDKCKCFNLTAHIGIFPDYFICGLESLDHGSHSQKDINRLKKRLRLMVRDCKGKLDFTSLFVKYDPVISPAVLVQELESVAQQIKSLLSHPTSRRR